MMSNLYQYHSSTNMRSKQCLINDLMLEWFVLVSVCHTVCHTLCAVPKILHYFYHLLLVVLSVLKGVCCS